jgi:hypothetical protein
MPGEKLCPNCGNILRAEGLPDPVPAGRQLGRELLFWLALAMVLAFLLNAGTTGERVGGLGAIALLIWLVRRSRRRAAPAGDSATGRYRCDYCQGRFEGEDLRDISPRRAEW